MVCQNRLYPKVVEWVDRYILGNRKIFYESELAVGRLIKELLLVEKVSFRVKDKLAPVVGRVIDVDSA